VGIGSDCIRSFAELYSISDLHMGGRDDGQIFDSGKMLAGFVESLTQDDRDIALVINGDFVDFLAEPGAKAFDPNGAIDGLDRISSDPSFAPAWAALRKFVRTKGRHLVITLGNHDLELALPWVGFRLRENLAEGDDAARGRITLAFDGAGFLCRVGNAKVLCVHGNEVDDWNVTDHEAIRRLGRDFQQGRSIESWIPNAGTRLVVGIMNEIKRDYPFVDLLKPEVAAVVPVLMAIAPEKRDRIARAVPVLYRLAGDKIRRAAGLLGDPDFGVTDAAEEHERPRRQRIIAESVMSATEERLQRRVEPISLVPLAEREEKLGLRRAAWNWIRDPDLRKWLRVALDGLQTDRSFEWAQEDDAFRRLDEMIGADIDFILAGHTHLERALKRRKGKGFYLNSGTWVRLIRLQSQMLADQTEFNKVYAAMAAGSMAALDACPYLVLRRHTVVAVRPNGPGTRGELAHWKEEGGSGRLVPLDNAGRNYP